MVRVFSITIIIWSACVASLEIEENGYIYSYLLAIFIVSVIFNFRNKMLLSLYVLGISSFTVSNYYNYEMFIPQDKIIFIVLTNFFCFFISRSLYAAKATNFLTNIQLSKTNDLLNEEIASRIEAEEELRALTQNLEKRVQERTRELEKTNFRLEAEILHHKATSNALSKSKDKLDKQNDTLTKLNEELDMFVYRTSHDIRGPISSVLGLLILLRNEPEENMVYFLLDKIEKSMHKLDGFIEEINEFSDVSRLETEVKQIYFQKNIEDIYDKLKELDAENQVEKIITVNNPTPFYSDEVRLKIILKNVIKNALIFKTTNEASKHIYIDVDTISEQNTAIITVEDNGTGIDDSVKHRIFDMFYRGNDISQGAGLGLYVAKTALSKLNGKITIESKLGAYTKVVIRIPTMKTPEKKKTNIEIKPTLTLK
ncbi:MAG: HAMP domain-containing sensor histidine kinase [Bacteroidota bacterium]